MTIKELREYLLEFPQDLPVVLSSHIENVFWDMTKMETMNGDIVAHWPGTQDLHIYARNDDKQTTIKVIVFN